MESDGENLEDYEAIEDNECVEIQNFDGEGNANHEETAGGEEGEEKQKKVIKPKRILRNPQPKLNAETLRGPRGLTAVAGLFSKQKFKGKGHEKEDLRVLLKTYNYWCHRMFPKYPFDQAIDKIEKLGNKKPVITFIKRIRMGLMVEEVEELQEEEVEEEQPTTQQTPVETNRDSEFDALLPPKPAEIKPAELTEEQLERIRANKERALKLRQERLRKIQQQAESKLKPSHVLTESLEHNENSQQEIGGNSQCTESEISSQNTYKFNDIVDKPQTSDDNDHRFTLKDSDAGDKENKSDSEDSQIDEIEINFGKSKDVEGNEINVSILEREFNSQNSEIVLSNKSVFEEDYNRDRSESPILGQVKNTRKEKVHSSTMIQNSIDFEEAIGDDLNTVEGAEQDNILSDEAGLSVLNDDVKSLNSPQNINSMEVDFVESNIIPVSSQNNTEKQTYESEINKTVSALDSNDVIEDTISSNANNAYIISNENAEEKLSSNLSDINNEVIEQVNDGESESTDIIEDTPQFIHNKRILDKKESMEMDCDY